MKAHKGYYSLIQYCPDASRAEAANVGVLLFVPELRFIKARTERENRRIRRFFGGANFDASRVNAAKQAVEERLELEQDQFRSREDLQRFIDSRGNEILVTSPRPMKVFDAERELAQLFDELVERAPARRQRPVIRKLEEAMRSPDLRDRIRFDEEVSVPVVGTRLRVPYAYANGTENLIRPTQFDPDEYAAARQASYLAVVDQMFRRHESAERRHRLIVVSAPMARSRQSLPAVEQHIAPLFADLEVEFVRHDQIDALIQRVKREAHT